ncbi:MAG: beta-lactamase family protein [Anaerolineae bacterium]|nr:beta-lactamase family protein [Anaerolineae bacterium]
MNLNTYLTEFEIYVISTLRALAPCAGALLISQRDQVLLERYFPSTGSPALVPPVDENALWYIFSVTKSFAAALLLNLATEGVVGLDEPVIHYLPDFAVHAAMRDKVTLRHLASHTSGVTVPDEPASLNDLASGSLDAVEIITEPGIAFNYSQLGMIILEYALEVATGDDFGTQMRARILDPLGLHDTRYLYDTGTSLPLLPIESGTSIAPERTFHVTPNPGRAGTGLYTTARDLHRFGQFWLTKGRFEGRTYFSSELRREVWTHHGTRESDGGRYGLLWWLFEEDGGYVMSGAAHSLCAVVPETQVVVTILRNHQGPAPGPYNYYEDKRQAVRFGKSLLARTTVEM